MSACVSFRKGPSSTPTLAPGIPAATRRDLGDPTMSSSWPILLGVVVIVVAAFWYDATIAPAARPPGMPPSPTSPM
jgi:hypothetical protein